jgi:hypothetical protein
MPGDTRPIVRIPSRAAFSLQSAWKEWLAVAVVFVLGQVGSWALHGRRTLARCVGMTLPVDYRDAVQANRVRMAVKTDAPLAAALPTRVLFSGDGQPVDPVIVDAGRPMWRDLGVSLEVDPLEAGSPAFRRCVDSEDCFALLYDVAWNTPLYAEVGVTDFRYGSNEATWCYRYVWCLGVWVTITHRLCGMG